MKNVFIAAIVASLSTGIAAANEVLYSSQGGTNNLSASISGNGNSIGNSAPASTRQVTGRGTYTHSSSPWSRYGYDYVRTSLQTTYETTVTRSFPTDYSAAKQVGNNNTATTTQYGSSNSLNFSQGSDTAFTETRRRQATGSTYTRDFFYNRYRDYTVRASSYYDRLFNSRHGYAQTYQRGAVTTASDNRLEATQYGDRNAATINQLGDNNYASLYQSGYGNSADLLQGGDNAVLTVSQYGSENTATVRQYSMNTANLYQSGSDNQAEIMQGNASGSAPQFASVATVSSTGNDNYVSVTQAGYFGGNSVNISQNGNGNSASTMQTGRSSNATLTQRGDNNSFNLNQTAHAGAISVAMIGNGGNVNINHR